MPSRLCDPSTLPEPVPMRSSISRRRLVLGNDLGQESVHRADQVEIHSRGRKFYVQLQTRQRAPQKSSRSRLLLRRNRNVQRRLTRINTEKRMKKTTPISFQQTIEHSSRNSPP